MPGHKVPFVFRSLPGYMFYAIRAEREVIADDPAGHKQRWLEGWIQITYLRDGEDEEQRFGGFAGPRADS